MLVEGSLDAPWSEFPSVERTLDDKFAKRRYERRVNEIDLRIGSTDPTRNVFEVDTNGATWRVQRLSAALLFP